MSAQHPPWVPGYHTAAAWWAELDWAWLWAQVAQAAIQQLAEEALDVRDEIREGLATWELDYCCDADGYSYED